MAIRKSTGLYAVRFTVQAAPQLQTRTVRVPGDDLDSLTLGAIIRVLAADQGTPEPDIHVISAERMSGILEWFDDDEAGQTAPPRAAAPKANRQPAAK